MKYKGYYLTLFVPMIKKSISVRFGKELAEKAVGNGKDEYRKLLQNAPELGNNNPMASNAYFAYVFVGAWLGTNKEISPEEMGLVMQDVLKNVRFFFGLVDLNKDEKKWYRDMKKYESWCQRKGAEKYPTTWKVNFDETQHWRGSYYYFTSCPICSYLNSIGLGEIMKPLCETDKYMFAYQHGTLYREHTIADGAEICDYWIVGDRLSDPE